MKRMGVIKFVFCSLFCFALLAVGVQSQTTSGTISGTVKDKTGAVIPNVTVTATNEATNVVNTVQTNDAGAYSFLSLPVGKYDVEAKQTGFTDYKQMGITLDVNDHLVIDVAMEVGAVTQTVEVSANAAHVETSSATLGNVIGGQTIQDQPLLNRSYIDLMGLQAGVNVSTGGGSVSGMLSAGNVSVSGSRSDANGFTVNGGNVEEGEANGTSIIPNADSIAEFKIITNSAAAEYGHYSGGAVSVITKSGTNSFHGDGFEFFRNQNFNAIGYFKNPNPTYSENQFGGTLGGPIKHNKLFFFGDYQGTRFNETDVSDAVVPTAGTAAATANDGKALLPTSNELAGDLADRTDAAAYSSPYNDFYGSVSSPGWATTLTNRFSAAGIPETVTAGEAYYADGCTSSSGANACVFPNAIIPKAVWAAPAVALLAKFVPPPTAGIESGNLPAFQSSSSKTTTKDDKLGARIDADTAAGQLSFYYFYDNSTVVNPFAGGNLPGFGGTTPARAQQVNFGDTKTFGGNQLNDLRINFTRTRHINNSATGGLGPSYSSLGFTEGGNGLILAVPGYQGVPEFDTNEFTGGISNSQVHQADNTWQISDAYSIIHGNHQFKFGGEGNYVQVIERNIYAPNGEFDFGGNETGDDYADFLIGSVNSFTQAAKQALDSRAWYYGAFVQDTWRIKPSFTLNYGLRQDVSTFWYDTQNKIQAIVPGLSSTVFPGAPTGWVFPGDPGVPRTLAPTHYNNFAPRVAFAYSPDFTSGPMNKIFGSSGKTAIRGAWGIFYTVVDDGTLFDEVADAPFGLFWQQSNTQFQTPWVQMNGNITGQHFPFTPPPPGDANINWAFYEPIASSPGLNINDRLPYTEEYNFTIERQISPGMVATVAYVGSQGHRLAAAAESNPGIPNICQFLSNPANLAPGSDTCGPGNENDTFTLNAANAAANGGNSTIYGTRLPLGFNFAEGDQYWLTTGRSTYNSLQATVRRTGKRYNFLAAYTWEKSMDTGSTQGSALDPLPNPLPQVCSAAALAGTATCALPSNIFTPNPPTVTNYGAPDYNLFRALSSFDTPQDFVISYSYTLPFDKITNRFSRLTNGWTVTGTTRFATGTPIGVSYSKDNSYLGAFGNDYPNFQGGNLTHLNPRTSGGFWIADPKTASSTKCGGAGVYCAEQPGTIGNAMREFIIGPGINNTDLSLQKNVAITGERQLQFRIDTFNVFNHTQFSSPSGSFTSGSFMKVTSARAARIAQLGVKFLF
ncbi:MAG TPA: carboxypeptidase regulatory-like domain-containing protein [Candidatus Acidoferrales bacterium]